jgi:hypothetical protein
VSQEQASDRLASLTDASTRCHRSRPRALEAEIASHQHLSLATVKAHAARLLAKLDVDNQVQIALLVKRPSQDAPNERGRCAVSRTSLDECLRAGRATSLATVTVPFEAPVRTAARLGSVVTRN